MGLRPHSSSRRAPALRRHRLWDNTIPAFPIPEQTSQGRAAWHLHGDETRDCGSLVATCIGIVPPGTCSGLRFQNLGSQEADSPRNTQRFSNLLRRRIQEEYRKGVGDTRLGKTTLCFLQPSSCLTVGTGP